MVVSAAPTPIPGRGSLFGAGMPVPASWKIYARFHYTLALNYARRYVREFLTRAASTCRNVLFFGKGEAANY